MFRNMFRYYIARVWDYEEEKTVCTDKDLWGRGKEQAGDGSDGGFWAC
ncbi:hypothetical protein SDC9_164133 [bioreactor metagenome]|uniref:Uncharacterized protein n=1 Tax=bioreactor metagenome TaxID=1076179 RepID=A0A645FST6_9ZZZZ